jgi:hypothetical protein
MKDLPADQRPREKLLARGAAALADAELLALLLRTGYKGHGVMALATPGAGQDAVSPACCRPRPTNSRPSRAWGRPSGPNCWR